MKSIVAALCLILYISTQATGYPVFNQRYPLVSLLLESQKSGVCPQKSCPRLTAGIPDRCIVPTIYFHERHLCFGCNRNKCFRSPPYRWYQFQYV